MKVINEKGEFISGQGVTFVPKSLPFFYTLDETGRIVIPYGKIQIASISVQLFPSSLVIRTR